MELNTIYTGDALEVLRTLPDSSVDCVITSPPYWGLRDYGVAGQLGQEDAPEAYIEKLLEVFREVHRVLKPSGTCFVNLGDTYAGGGAGTTKNADISEYIRHSKQSYILPNGVAKSTTFRGTNKNKSLLMTPYRFAWQMVEAGWVLRNIIVWHKPNQMPCPARDRFTVDFEPVFFFTKMQKYHFIQQLEPIKQESIRRAQSGWHGKVMANGKGAAGIERLDIMGTRFANPAGRNMRTTWSINTQAFKGGHFAAYPEKLVERMLLAGCPPGGVVLDPFIGAGTTAVVAQRLGRSYVGIELNPDYVKMAKERLGPHA
jgi:site-specific DNA-methyltransferase (adenine-specific)